MRFRLVRNGLEVWIPFAALPRDVIHRVVDKFVAQLEGQLADRNVTIALTDEARAWLAERGYDKLYGARPLGRVIQEHIKKPLADELLFGQLVKGGHEIGRASGRERCVRTGRSRWSTYHYKNKKTVH